jgi:hypothetical protein
VSRRGQTRPALLLMMTNGRSRLLVGLEVSMDDVGDPCRKAQLTEVELRHLFAIVPARMQ